MTLTIAFTEPAGPHERGLRFGSAHADRVRESWRAYSGLFAASGIGEETVRRVAEEALGRTAEWSAPLATEIAGLAEGAALAPWQAAALSARSEVLATARVPLPGECSTSVHLPAAGGTRTVQTWDWNPAMRDTMAVWRYRTADRTVTTFTELGVLAKIGLSSAGLGVHFNLLQHDADGGETGVPVHLVARRLLDEAATLAEARDLLATVRVSASVALTVVARGGAGRAPEAATFELSPAGHAELPADDGFVQHTNHFLDPALAAGDRLRPVDEDTVHRQRELVARRPRLASPDLAERARALLLHAADGAQLCAHADPAEPERARWQTLAAISLDLERSELVVRDGTLCSGDLEEWVRV